MNVERDGEWAIAALRRTIDNGGGSESVGCRIDALVGGDIKMNREFAALLVRSIERGDHGMPLRDWFAGQAISTMIHKSETSEGGWDVGSVAAGCYAIADAMLAQRKEV